MARPLIPPRHSRTAANVVSRTESEFDLLELSPSVFEEDIELETCLVYLEHHEEECEDALLMNLLLEADPPSTTPAVVVVNHVDAALVDMEERKWGGVDVLSVGTTSSFEQYNVPLRDADIVCSRGIYTKADQAGNVRMRRIISEEYVVRWGKATLSEQLDLLVQIGTEIARGPQNPRFLFTGMREGDILYCREASVKEVENEIHDELLGHFKIVPNEQDYIFGKGKPIYTWPGNAHYRDYMSKRIPKYRRQDSIGKEIIIKEVKKYVAHQGGRFLYPFDNANPKGGCIEVDDDRDIEEKLKSVLRVSKGGLASRRGKSPSRSPSSQRDIPEGCSPQLRK